MGKGRDESLIGLRIGLAVNFLKKRLDGGWLFHFTRILIVYLESDCNNSARM